MCLLPGDSFSLKRSALKSNDRACSTTQLGTISALSKLQTQENPVPRIRSVLDRDKFRPLRFPLGPELILLVAEVAGSEGDHRLGVCRDAQRKMEVTRSECTREQLSRCSCRTHGPMAVSHPDRDRHSETHTNRRTPYGWIGWTGWL